MVARFAGILLGLSVFCTAANGQKMQLQLLSGDSWRIAVDSANTGIADEWFKNPPVAASRPTPVPWVIQDVFHDYHGVAWYWRSFEATPLKAGDERQYLLKFHAIDYLADVWINGVWAGRHEGNQTAFELNVGGLLKRAGKNLLVVRILNPTYFPIDGIGLKDVPSSLKHYPYTSNAVYNSGGIIGEVELKAVSPVRTDKLLLAGDWKTGHVTVSALVQNSLSSNVTASLIVHVSEAGTGRVVSVKKIEENFPAGEKKVLAAIAVPDHRLWSPNDPALYRVRVTIETEGYAHETSARFGFRDFRFENGYFRLNGKRIFLKGCNFSTHYPVGYTVPLQEEMLRRDVIHMKALGFNFVRIPFGCPNPRVLDIYDELGIMVHQEHYGSWQMGEYGGYKYPQPPDGEELLLKRFEKSIKEVVRRDWNHPSIVMWGVLNEHGDGSVFRKAVSLLPDLRTLDPYRIFVLNSGRFDRVSEIGSMSNPGSGEWDISESELKDWHPYVWIPYSTQTLKELSGKENDSGQKIFISESGLCFPIDLPSELGDYQRVGKEEADDARYFRRQYEKFMADWDRFGLNQCWVRPEDYIQSAYETASQLREIGDAAIRSNPALIAYTPTNGVADYSMGESVATNFRRLKPELIGAVLLSNSDLRWCLATEPQSIYRGQPVELQVSLSNLDVLPAGFYPATIRVVGPQQKVVYEKTLRVEIPENINGEEAPFAQEVWREKIVIQQGAGAYQLLASLDSGGTANAGKTFFHVSEEDQLPALPTQVVLAGTDTVLSTWLKQAGVRIIPITHANESERHAVLVAGKKAPDSVAMLKTARLLARGSTVLFLSPSALARGKHTTAWLPLTEKGRMEPMDHVAGYYRADRWAKQHPIFEGMHTGGMIDYRFFRNLISKEALSQEYTVRADPAHTWREASTPLAYPDETVCGATRISHIYTSGVHIGVWNFHEGKFILNTLHIVENLGTDPAADRLLANMLNFAAEGMDQPAAALPANFDHQLEAIGYITK